MRRPISQQMSLGDGFIDSSLCELDEVKQMDVARRDYRCAMAERAECVMLNKGPYVVQAVQMLDDVLIRMQSHQAKKVSLLRPLTLARRFCCGEDAR